MALERLDSHACADRLQMHLHQQRYDFVLERLGPGESVLEIGTGVGSFTETLFPRCGSYVGVEFDVTACAEARKRTSGKAEILQADARHLPLPDESFSFIICLEVLEHLGDWRAGVRHIHRCLKNDGTAIISVPYRLSGGKSKTNEFHPYEPGEGELVEFLQDHFSEVSVTYQFFAESLFMTAARALRIRRFVGLAGIYAALANGETSALAQLGVNQQAKGLKIGLLITARNKRTLRA